MFVSVFVCALVSVSHAQSGDPKWKVDLGGKADWLTITSAGTVVTSAGSSLICIDPAKQQKIWEIKATGVTKESFVELEGTPFAIFDGVSKGLKSQTAIIDFLTGRMIYNNVEADVVIRQKTPLVDIGVILLEIKQEKKVYLSLIDIASGKERWRFELPDKKTGFGLGALKEGIASALTASSVSDKDGNILYPDQKILKRLDAQTGKVLWTVENEKSVGKLNFSEDGNTVYVGAGKKISALSLADGKDLWKDPVKINGEFQMFIPTADNKMYVVTSYEINQIEQSTGKATWKKPVTFSNTFKSLKFTTEGILVYGGDEKASMFDYIGFDGTQLWKRPYTTEPIFNFRLTSKGIFFATASEGNMIDLKTGDDTIWKKRIKLKGSPVTYLDDKIALVYSDGKLYRINMETLNYEMINEEIKFKGSEEDVKRIEVVSTGYLLSSSQNMWLVGADGKTVYSVYYKPASLGTAAKILGTMGQVYATATNLEAEQDPNNPGTTTIKRSERGDEITSGIGDVIKNRKSTFSTQDAQFIMTRVEDADSKRVGMIKVDKASGKEAGKIVLKDMEPVYEIDYVTGQLYVLNGSDMLSFSL